MSGGRVLSVRGVRLAADLQRVCDHLDLCYCDFVCCRPAVETMVKREVVAAEKKTIPHGNR